MHRVVKVGPFSNMYSYILTDEGSYFLIETGKVEPLERLIGSNVPCQFCRTNGLKRGFVFCITPLRICIYFISLLVLSFFIYQKYATLTVVLWSFSAHEFSHLLTAYLIGSSELFLGLKLQYLLIPMVYISNRNIYERPKKQRMAYYFAGVFANLLLSILSVLCSLFFNNGLFEEIWKINLIIALINIFPLLFTDGYNLLREVVEIYDLRQMVLVNFLTPWKLYRISRVAFFYHLFVIFSILFMLVKIFFFFFR